MKVLGVEHRGKSYCVDFASETEFSMQDHDQNFIHSKNLSPADCKKIGRHYRAQPRLKGAALAIRRFNWRWVAVGVGVSAAMAALAYFCA